MSFFPGLSLGDANRITFAQARELLKRAKQRRLEDQESMATFIIAKLGQALSGKVEQIIKPAERAEDANRPPRQLSEKDMQILAPFMAKE